MCCAALCRPQGEDQAHCVPVHTLQLGQVRVEAGVHSAALAGRAGHHLHGGLTGGTGTGAVGGTGVADV